ncbi:DUF4184 family protein [Dactylosporangium sp. NPDC006015]|uniref:DUF4184 family protein n=1 Tax=Dactylosporangium sp. NPDC006015 TaxID=3154576 RepID=UPI0033AAD56F
MPSTLPTHPLAVLPLKLWRPRWFDGVALAVGATTPDIAYALGDAVTIRSHTVAAAFWWGLPVTVFTAWLIRLGAPVVAAHLPGSLPELGVLGRVRHRWWVTATSALLGDASHLLWDLVTHPQPEVIASWRLVRDVSDYAALLLLPLFIWYVQRRHLVREWHGAAPVVARRPWLFWSCAVETFAACAFVVGNLHYGGPHVFVVRLIVSAVIALLTACLALHFVRAPGDRPVAAAALPQR